jgi:23S rRNA (uridine2552-2'-O)-methyltransferase
MSRPKSPYARPDARTRAAKAGGYPARSVFKLKEIDDRLKIFRRGMRVLDLGASPGSWTLYASERVGAEGRVVAVDLKAAETALPANVIWIEGDAFQLASVELGRAAPYDVIVSDMAPSTSGSKVRDQAQSFELFMRALEVAKTHGKPGAHFAGKLFMSSDFQAARTALARSFGSVKVVRPEGTRQQSSEVFLVGLALRDPE